MSILGQGSHDWSTLSRRNEGEASKAQERGKNFFFRRREEEHLPLQKKPKCALQNPTSNADEEKPKKQVVIKEEPLDSDQSQPPAPQHEAEHVGMYVDAGASHGVRTEAELLLEGVPEEAYHPPDPMMYQAKYYRFSLPLQDEDRCVQAVATRRHRWNMHKPVARCEDYYVYRVDVRPYLAYLIVPEDAGSAEVLGIVSDYFQFIQEFHEHILKPFKGEFICDG